MFRDVNHSRGSSPPCALVAMVLTISVDRRLDSLEAQRGMRKPEDNSLRVAQASTRLWAECRCPGVYNVILWRLRSSIRLLMHDVLPRPL